MRAVMYSLDVGYVGLSLPFRYQPMMKLPVLHQVSSRPSAYDDASGPVSG